MPSAKITLFLVSRDIYCTDNVRRWARRRRLIRRANRNSTAPLEPLRPGVAEDQIFAELLAHNERGTRRCSSTQPSEPIK